MSHKRTGGLAKFQATTTRVLADGSRFANEPTTSDQKALEDAVNCRGSHVSVFFFPPPFSFFLFFTCSTSVTRSGVADELSFRVRKLDVVCGRVSDARLSG